ncbi:hypothetical protein SSBR45G_46850 [Bradyrhizobium sp. SSBR45G]|uniref:hypothetical protein n=1 Tax=unclassified Bradyrhizobium TaxID=2631580 RepID=UPI002342A768|nr:MULTISPECIES: hypothetical protein [unclassified Bradyrhizobium]GLH79776.1 hypothetical protein SSBR45G_46850 [Bradyrhizobium sp. SSBR45G]GLH87106.1 hypothetical protein SSBR45R_45660 [Bradyrhizobium sp. SSBR45R]
MPFQRVEITRKIVQEALGLAAAKAEGVHVFADTQVRYLTVRVRGGSAKWTLRAMRTMRVLGDLRERHPEFLSISDARKRAAELYAEMRYADPQEDAPADDEPVAWTLGRVCLGYMRMLAQPRWINNELKPPSDATNDDVRLAFAQASYQVLGAKLVTDLSRPLLNEARDGVTSYRQRQKCVAYIKAALGWAADKHPDESGLTEGVDRWWDRLSAGDPDPATMREIETRRAQHRQNKADLTTEAVAATLIRHEAYCAEHAERGAEHKVSPGIRWGLWWICFTANRRASTVQLRRDGFMDIDPFGEEGWGRATWSAAEMKAKSEFWLPLPPVVTSIAAGSIADYTQLVANQHGDWPSAYVFASTRRFGRDADNDDVHVYPNSINRHLQRMRAAGALDGLPLFNPHLVRSPVGDYIEDKVNGAASSLVLSHKMKQDGEEAARTTRQFYLVSQRMREKAAGMRAWSEALVESFLRQGGTLPTPTEGPRKPKSRPKKRDPDLRAGVA